MIKRWRFKYDGGGLSPWTHSPMPDITELHNSTLVVGVEWEHDNTPCEEMTPFGVEGESLKCENKGCDGKHSAFYEAQGAFVAETYVEVTWTTPTDSEK